jgi:hypothetical protein
MYSEQIASGDLADFGATLDERFKPVLIFLVCSTGLLNEIRLLLESIKKSIRDTPIIFVNESHEPNDVLQLLKAGGRR